MGQESCDAFAKKQSGVQKMAMALLCSVGLMMNVALTPFLHSISSGDTYSQSLGLLFPVMFCKRTSVLSCL